MKASTKFLSAYALKILVALTLNVSGTEPVFAQTISPEGTPVKAWIGKLPMSVGHTLRVTFDSGDVCNTTFSGKIARRKGKTFGIFQNCSLEYLIDIKRPRNTFLDVTLLPIVGRQTLDYSISVFLDDGTEIKLAGR